MGVRSGGQEGALSPLPLWLAKILFFQLFYRKIVSFKVSFRQILCLENFPLRF